MSDISLGYRQSFFGSRGAKLVIPEATRVKHMHIYGRTGSGKSTLMLNLILQDVKNGAGLAVINPKSDPKADLIDEILQRVPVERFDDVILFEPRDTERPLGFNVLEAVGPDQRSLAASQVVSIFKKLFADSWGPRLEHVLRFSILTLLEIPGATLVDVSDLLLDKEFRTALVRQVTNPMVRRFWEIEFREITKGREYINTIQPILNKVSTWLAYPELCNIIGQPWRSSFDVREAMDRRKILLVNIPKGLLGEDTSKFLGAMIVAKIQLAAMTRMGATAKIPFYLYVDEFQDFITSAFENILTQARSYGLGLIMANQYDEQLYDQLRFAVLKNVAYRVECYQERDKYLGTIWELQDVSADPQVLIPLPPPTDGHHDLPKQIRYTMRQIHGRPREEVERAILGRREQLLATKAYAITDYD